MHGKTLATQSASGVPFVRSTVSTYNWPTASNPKLKYPLSYHNLENKIEEDR